ncbi:MAG: hypothetical protein IT342_13705 [Candidatus Melainabacteria bacterium]|nr:hypothetical protein [Candidatus Melainabacteria bacterium]
MNQSAQASSPDKKDNKQLAAGELAYEFFQPVFESTLNYEFTAGSTNNAAPTSSNLAASPVAPLAPLSPLAPLAPSASVKPAAQAPPATPIAPTASVAPVSSVFTANPVSPVAQTAIAETPAATVPNLPPFISSLVDAAFSVETPTIALKTVGSLAAENLSAASSDKQFVDDSGAVISYGRWNIKPHRIRYPDRSTAEFEYDETEMLVRVKDRDGMEWVRITHPDHKNISTWQSTDGQTCDMSMVVIPDGTYQCISKAGVIQTCTLTGRIVVWTPFTIGFNLKRTLFAIFRSIDKNQDSSLSKEELDLAARQIWQESDAVQLISMLQSHFDAISATRRHALCRQGNGITIDDILAFDDMTASEQESRCSAPPHAVTAVKTLFDELNTSAEGAVTIHQVRMAYDKKHERDSVYRTILQTLHEELKRAYDANNSGYASKASNLTRSDLVQHYKDGYKREIRGQIKIAGWGTDECWQQGATSTRTLYVDPSNPLESILPQAIKHYKADHSMGNFMAIFESMVVQCPHIVARMISETKDGKYKVTFPGQPQKPITVNPPTSSCLAEYLHGSKFGFWMAVIESAYRQYEAGYDGKTDLDHLQSVERISHLLNGQSGRWMEVKDVPLSSLGNSMKDAFRQRRLMIAVGLHNSPRVAGSRIISRSPVCGIVNFDHRNGRVIVNDPVRDNAGDQFSEISKNHSNCNPDGSATLSLSAFSTAFDKIYVEDWLPSDDMFQK